MPVCLDGAGKRPRLPSLRLFGARLTDTALHPYALGRRPLPALQRATVRRAAIPLARLGGGLGPRIPLRGAGRVVHADLRPRLQGHWDSLCLQQGPRPCGRRARGRGLLATRTWLLASVRTDERPVTLGVRQLRRGHGRPYLGLPQLAPKLAVAFALGLCHGAPPAPHGANGLGQRPRVARGPPCGGYTGTVGCFLAGSYGHRTKGRKASCPCVLRDRGFPLGMAYVARHLHLPTPLGREGACAPNLQADLGCRF